MGNNATLIFLGFIAVLSFRNKPAWFLGILVFIGGLYSLFFTAYSAAEPTAMQFTPPIIRVLFDEEHSPIGAKLIGSVPEFFCIAGLALFISPHVRRLYWN